MSGESIQLKEAQPSIVRVTLVMRWLDDGPCTHHAEREIDYMVEGIKSELTWRSNVQLYEPALFNDHCLHCGEPAHDRATYHSFSGFFFPTDTGLADAGSIYRVPIHDPGQRVECFNGCDGFHTAIILPSYETWCLEMPAPDCGMPDDHNHRCFYIAGTFPDLTIWPSSCGATKRYGVELWDGVIKAGVITDARLVA